MPSPIYNKIIKETNNMKRRIMFDELSDLYSTSVTGFVLADSGTMSYFRNSINKNLKRVPISKEYLLIGASAGGVLFYAGVHLGKRLEREERERERERRERRERTDQNNQNNQNNTTTANQNNAASIATTNQNNTAAANQINVAPAAVIPTVANNINPIPAPVNPINPNLVNSSSRASISSTIINPLANDAIQTPIDDNNDNDSAPIEVRVHSAALNPILNIPAEPKSINISMPLPSTENDDEKKDEEDDDDDDDKKAKKTKKTKKINNNGCREDNHKRDRRDPDDDNDDNDDNNDKSNDNTPLLKGWSNEKITNELEKINKTTRPDKSGEAQFVLFSLAYLKIWDAKKTDDNHIKTKFIINSLKTLRSIMIDYNNFYSKNELLKDSKRNFRLEHSSLKLNQDNYDKYGLPSIDDPKFFSFKTRNDTIPPTMELTYINENNSYSIYNHLFWILREFKFKNEDEIDSNKMEEFFINDVSPLLFKNKRRNKIKNQDSLLGNNDVNDMEKIEDDKQTNISHKKNVQSSLNNESGSNKDNRGSMNIDIEIATNLNLNREDSNSSDSSDGSLTTHEGDKNKHEDISIPSKTFEIKDDNIDYHAKWKEDYEEAQYKDLDKRSLKVLADAELLDGKLNNLSSTPPQNDEMEMFHGFPRSKSAIEYPVNPIKVNKRDTPIPDPIMPISKRVTHPNNFNKKDTPIPDPIMPISKRVTHPNNWNDTNNSSHYEENEDGFVYLNSPESNFPDISITQESLHTNQSGSTTIGSTSSIPSVPIVPLDPSQSLTFDKLENLDITEEKFADVN